MAVQDRKSPPAAEIVFLFIGGAHQVYHLAPVAAELVRSQANRPVVCLSADDATTAALRAVRASMAVPDLRIEDIRVPWWGRLLSAMTGRKSSNKRPLLFSIRRRLARAAAIVTPERTSSVLRGMGPGLRNALMIHFRHGAGDRAPKSEAKLSAFDIVAVPGDKDMQRAVTADHLPPDRLRLCGYVKLDYCRRLVRQPLRLFDNDRPTVFYNPHFDPTVSSLPVAREVVRRFAQQSRYNLLFCPHIRALENASTADIAAWRDLAVDGRVLVDLDSPRLFDMTYVLGADIYLGDMSSQLYEFLAIPRPVAFVNAHRVEWRDNPRYAGWHLGEVADDPDQVIAAVDRAVAGQAEKAERQRQAVVTAFGDIDGAAARGAAIVAEALGAARTVENPRRSGVLQGSAMPVDQRAGT